MTSSQPEPQPIGLSHYPRDFWQGVAEFAERPILQRISGCLSTLDDRTLELVYAYADALSTAQDGTPGLDFIPDRDGQLGALMDGLLTHDAGARARVLDRFEAWRERSGE